MMKQGLVRIIGGEWRGRRLKVPDIKDLRPTPDRVRETIFNWLAHIIPGANCLDVFAGSGVLGFEALSRGAHYVEMVDQSQLVVTLLQEELTVFGAKNALIYRASAPLGLRKGDKKFDVVFLDPPYGANLLPACSHYLEDQGFLADHAYIYLEARTVIQDNELPVNWRIIKNKQAGQVVYHLAERVKNNEQSAEKTTSSNR